MLRNMIGHELVHGLGNGLGPGYGQGHELVLVNRLGNG